jgi:co-chaperonin GroES (HSP10)
MTNTTGVTPIRDQVLVRRDQAQNQTRGGLFVPEKMWPQLGTVLAVGPWIRDPELVPGARVLFRPRAGSALVPDSREPGARDTWERVVMLQAGVDHEGRDRGVDARRRNVGDILAVVEEA